MFPAVLSERLDTLIDDLIMDGGVETASLASILLAAKDSVKCDYHVTLSRWVWTANNELKAERGWEGADLDAVFDEAAPGQRGSKG